MVLPSIEWSNNQDSTVRGLTDPVDIMPKVEARTRHQKALALARSLELIELSNPEFNRRVECSKCQLIGRGALCAAEIPWHSPAFGAQAMQRCADIVATGSAKPRHGKR